MKNKNLLSIFCFVALLCSCRETNNYSSNKNSLNSTNVSSTLNASNSTSANISSSTNISSITSSISSSTGPTFEVPTTNAQLLDLINTTSYDLAKNHESSYTYSKTSYPQKYDFEDYGYMNYEEITSKRYLDHTTKEITIKKAKSSNLIDYSDVYSFNGVMFIGNHENKNINLEKYDTSNVPNSEYIAKTNSLSLLEIEEGKELNDYLFSDLYQKLNSWIEVLDNKGIYTKINDDGSLSLIISVKKTEEQVMKTEVELSMRFDASGFISNTHYTYKTFSYDWNTNNFKTTTTDYIIEEYICQYGLNIEDNDNLTVVNPADYILTDAEIGLIENNSYNQVLLDLNNIKVGTSIKPFIVSVVPSTALDRTFKIVSSSNPEVVAENYGVWKCMKAGTTTLTLTNELGFEKNIDINVYAPVVESISLSVSNPNMVVGNSYQLYIYYTPYDAISTFVVSSNNNDVATVTYEDEKYMINCLTEGTTTITVTSIEFPNVSNTIDITVSSSDSDNTFSTTLVENNWSVYSYNTYTQLYLNFYDDGRGILYDSYGESASFTWELDGNKVTLSEIYFYYNYEYTTFIENVITISDDGNQLYARFSDGFYTVMIETFSKSY